VWVEHARLAQFRETLVVWPLLQTKEVPTQELVVVVEQADKVRTLLLQETLETALVLEVLACRTP
jgi:hypothetical protein